MRPQKARIIDELPQWNRFTPDGRPAPEETVLSLDMFEALRLVDALDLPMLDAARRMNISAPTLCRLVGAARKRVAKALCAGNVLVLEGGNIALRQPDALHIEMPGGRGNRMHTGQDKGMGQRRGMRGPGRGPHRRNE